MDEVRNDMEILLSVPDDGRVDSRTFLAHHASGHDRSARHSWVTARADPADHVLIWCRAGRTDVVCGGVGAVAGPGDLVVLPQGLPHRYEPRPDAPWEWWWVHLGGVGAPALIDRLRVDAGPVVRVGSAPGVTVRFTELVTAASRAAVTGQEAEALVVDATAHALVATLVAGVAARGAALSGAGDLAGLTAWILDHLDEPFVLADLAAAAGWSPAQLTRLTRRELGMSPVRYATQLRMGQARRLLRDTDLAVGTVAAMVGFADPLHFSRRFREVVGSSPRAYREGDGA